MFGGTPRFSSIHPLPERALKRDSAAPVFLVFSPADYVAPSPQHVLEKLEKCVTAVFAA